MRKQVIYPVFLFASASIFFLSCQKEINRKQSTREEVTTTANNGIQNEAKKVYVSNISQLYTAINDPDNIGATIILAPGTYLLSPNYPKGGLLELQYNMSLVGQPGHPELVIIDATGLPDASFTLLPSPGNPFTLRKGVVRIGNGRNAVEWMTLQNDPGHSIRSLIQTDIVATTTTQVRIAHTIIKGSSIGVDILNWRTESSGRIVEAELENNEITSNILTPSGTGIEIRNSHAVNGASVKVKLKGNYLHGNRVGLAFVNSRCTQNNITAESIEDRIENNGLGIAFIGGNSSATMPGANNSILFEAYGTAIWNNSGILPPLEFGSPGGVFAAAGIISAVVPPGTTNNNKLGISFYGCSIKNNIGDFQITAYGAQSLFPSLTPAGSNNTTSIYLHGVSKQATVNAINSFPNEPAGTNSVNIFR